jgi:hypothetical protein
MPAPLAAWTPALSITVKPMIRDSESSSLVDRNLRV